MSLAILFHFLCAQHVSDINIPIIRSLRLFCWISTLVVLFLVRCVLEFRCDWVGVVSGTVWYTPLLCVQWKTPGVGQRNCPKHVELYSKNTFETLMHPVGFIIRIYHDARSSESQILCNLLISSTRPTLHYPVLSVLCICTNWSFKQTLLTQ